MALALDLVIGPSMVGARLGGSSMDDPSSLMRSYIARFQVAVVPHAPRPWRPPLAAMVPILVITISIFRNLPYLDFLCRSDALCLRPPPIELLLHELLEFCCLLLLHGPTLGRC